MLCHGLIRRHFEPSRPRPLTDEILEVARAQFLVQGWTRMTVKAIAGAAAAAPATVYAIFGTKRAMLSVLIDQALASALPDPNRPDAWPETVCHPDQWERARRLVALMSAALPRVAPLECVVGEGADADEEIAGLARDLLQWRRATAARIVDVLAGEEGLRPGLGRQEAADLVFALGGPEVYHLLVEIRGWSPQQFDAHLAQLLGRLINSPEGTPKRRGWRPREQTTTTQKKAHSSQSRPQQRRDVQP